MDSVSELDMLLSLALAVAENKNEMKNISQSLSFIYPGDSEFISEETLSSFEKKYKKYWDFFLLYNGWAYAFILNFHI